jgi:signal transduction histidine kinase
MGISIVINNLISNALKYSNQFGSLTIVLKEVNSIIECHISDTDRNSAEDEDKIFNQFFRSQSSSHPEIKGTGLDFLL